MTGGSRGIMPDEAGRARLDERDPPGPVGDGTA